MGGIEKKKNVVGRFAPTPSGRMHVGNLFSCLLAWLSARSQGGKVILRMEDLDTLRTSRAFAQQIERDLLYLGLDWDEGGSKGGPAGPYWQSQRGDYYQRCLDRLEEMGLVYPCFCSRAQLHAAERNAPNAPHASDGEYVYSGRCRSLTPAQAETLRKQRPPAMRLKAEGREGFLDGHYGWVEQDLAAECGDFILRRSDGVFAYQLAVAADDGAMGVTEVVRGADLLGSTPRQLYLYRLLGLEAPCFAHVPLLLAGDGRRLSKRDGDLGLDALAERFSPEELVGRLAFLAGLLDRPAAVAARELVDGFSWEKVPKEDIRLPEGLF